MAKKPMDAKTIEIPSIDHKRLRFRVKGIAPLIQNRFTETATTAIRDKKLGAASKQSGKKKVYAKQDPEKECKEHTHFTNSGKYGVPVFAVSKCLVNTGMRNGIDDAVKLRAAFWVLSPNGDEQMLELSGTRKLREDIVILKNGAPDLCWRPQFDGWGLSFDVLYNTAKISADQLIQLVRLAGLETGLGAWRRENRNGWAGTFKIDGRVQSIATDSV